MLSIVSNTYNRNLTSQLTILNFALVIWIKSGPLILILTLPLILNLTPTKPKPKTHEPPKKLGPADRLGPVILAFSFRGSIQ